MSLGLFSNSCVVSTPDVELFNAMPNEIKINSKVIIEKTIKRLKHLGVLHYNFLADSSMNVEVSQVLSNFGEVKINSFEAIPNTFKQMWLEHFSISDRLSLVFNPTYSFNDSTLLSIEDKITKVLESDGTGEEDTKADKGKFEFTRDIFLLVALGYQITQKNLKMAKGSYEEALALMGMSKKMFEESIKNDLDSNFKEANNVFINYSSKKLDDMQHDLDEGEDESLNSIKGILAKIRREESKASDKSTFDFDFNRDSMKERIKQFTESQEEESYVPSIAQAFSSREGIQESYATGMHIEKFNSIEKLCNDYAVEVLKKLCESIPILINFYVTTTDRKYKLLNTFGGNRFCININLRTGETEVLLKNQTFKHNILFSKEEPVLVNANDWWDLNE